MTSLLVCLYVERRHQPGATSRLAGQPRDAQREFRVKLRVGEHAGGEETLGYRLHESGAVLGGHGFALLLVQREDSNGTVVVHQVV
jgi:hypothetical protein